MAYASSYFRSRYSAYRRAPRSTRRWTSGTRRRAWGNARAARQQRDAATVTISRIATSQVVISSGSQSNAVVINHWDSLRNSPYFSNYAPMYDQMKLDRIKIKVTGSQAGTAVTSNWSPSVVMAFDRNGLSTGQEMSSNVVSSYSSAQLKQWSSGNAFVMWQTIYPSTVMEKGQYIPTESLQDPTTVSDVSNPCYNYASPQLPFKPLTLLAVDMGAELTAENTFAFTIEYEYTVTFRGMRKPTIQTGITVIKQFYFVSEQVHSMSEFQYAPEQVTVSGGSVVILNIQPLEQTQILMNNINEGSYIVPAGSYYYHEPEPIYFSVTFIDKGGDEFCRIFDSTTSSSSPRVDFGPNIYFDIGQRNSTEE